MSATMSSQDEIKLAENPTSLMESKRLTVTATAKKVGMNKNTLHNYCNGLIPRHIGKLKLLADLFGISPDELIFGDKLQPALLQTSTDIEGRFEVTIKRVK